MIAFLKALGYAISDDDIVKKDELIVKKLITRTPICGGGNIVETKYNVIGCGDFESLVDDLVDFDFTLTINTFNSGALLNREIYNMELRKIEGV